jgi:hypothetical protein
MENGETVYKEKDYGECRLWFKEAAATPLVVLLFMNRDNFSPSSLFS